jgi:hypothetical protein
MRGNQSSSGCARKEIVTEHGQDVQMFIDDQQGQIIIIKGEMCFVLFSAVEENGFIHNVLVLSKLFQDSLLHLRGTNIFPCCATYKFVLLYKSLLKVIHVKKCPFILYHYNNVTLK